jgi:hypothetical protein
VAVELQGERPLANPGPALAKIRRPALDLIHADRGRLGHVVNSDDNELRHQIRPSAGPVPIKAFCMLQVEAGLDRPEIDELAGDPWPLLASTFNLVVDDEPRLRAQLDVCQAIARDARMLRVRVPDRPDASAADALRACLGVPTAA